MGRRVVISDNDCVAPSHRSSEERLREETERVEGQPRGRVCSPWLLGVSCNMWLYFLSQNFETTLGAAFLFLFLLLLQSCSWSAWLLFFPLHLFFWKQFKRHLEELMRQFAIYLGGFFSFGGDPKPFEGNRMVSLTLRSYGWGPWWELLWVYWQLGDISICEMIKYKWKCYSSECFSAALQLCFSSTLQFLGWGQNSVWVQEPL